MHDDDVVKSRVLGRREVLALLGASATAAACGMPETGMSLRHTARGATVNVPPCVVRPESIEGPYFVDRRLERTDLRIEPTTGARSEGAPLALTFTVSQIAGGACSALAGATVDVWQCDAAGVYSGVTDGIFETEGLTFLRGCQTTDRSGAVRFTTIYPGWYSGRAVHIHFKIRTAAPNGGRFEFTSQLYFEEALTDRVHARAPYAARGRRDMRNEEDTVFKDSVFKDGGAQLVLNTVEGPSGFAASFDLGLDLSDVAVGRPDSLSV